MNYKYLGNNKFEIRLTVFRDCWGGRPPFDSLAAIGFFDRNDSLRLNKLTPFRGKITIPPTVSDPCYTPPVDVCYEKTIYVDTVILPPIPGGYQVVYQRCCRNSTILNIVNPLQAGATYYANIPDTIYTSTISNSNPVFNDWPQLFLCANKPFVFDHYAIDTDGDSLVYDLFQPLHGADYNDPVPQPPYNPPYQNVQWNPPYNMSNMMGGIPLAIDIHTGLLTVTPNTQGQFVVGMKCKEYRNGILISETLRDLQFNVVACPKIVVAAAVVPLLNCDNNAVQFQNNSSGAISYKWDFGVTTISNDTSDLMSPQYNYIDTGTYTVKMIAYSNKPGCNDTTTNTVKIYPAPNATFNIQQITCADTVYFQNTSTFINTTTLSFTWNFGDNTTSTSTNPKHVYPSIGNYNVKCVAKSVNGCTDTIVKTVTILDKPTIDIEDTYSICKGDTVKFHATGGVKYSWTGPNFISSTLIADPMATPQQTSNYQVSVFVKNGYGDTCEYIRNVKVYISTLRDLVFTASTNKDTLVVGESASLTCSPVNVNYTYTWYPNQYLNKNTIPNPISTPDSTIEYQLVVIDTLACSVRLPKVRIVVVSSVCDEPYIFVPTGFTPNNDGNNDVFRVRGNNIYYHPSSDDFYLCIYNRWGEKVFETNDLHAGWDGTFKGTLQDPAVYAYYVKLKCVTGDTYFKKGNVTLIR